VPALTVARLSVNLMAGRVSGGLEGEHRQQYQAQRHSLFLTPAGAAVHWRKEQHSRHLNIYFHRKAYAEDEDGGSLLDADDPLLNAFVPGVQRLADELAGEVASHDPMAAEAADSLARLLLVRVLRRRIYAARVANPLSGVVMRRLEDYVAEHLAERILVADLAAVAGLSPDRFAHAYSRHAGQSPHQFVLAARLKRAVELLGQSTLGIAEVAATCGFASQQHLTQTMKRRLSTTPARYRQGRWPASCA
jgi:AraC family transcriptional regulator